MLDAFHQQAVKTQKLAQRIIPLFNMIHARIMDEYSRIYSPQLVDALFTRPIITPEYLSNIIGIELIQATDFLHELAEGGVIENEGKDGAPIFCNNKLLILMG